MRKTIFVQATRCLALLLVLAAEAASGATSLKVALSVIPSETLPGVPVNVSLTVSNVTDKDIAISNRVAFGVKSADGSSRRLTMYLPTQYWNGEVESAGKYVVPAGGKIDLFMPVTEDFDSPLFAERQLNDPGQYDLVVSVKGTSGITGDSNPAHLQILTPTGEDQAVWKVLDGEASGTEIKALCTTTIQKHPASRYYQLVSPFCVPFATLDQYAHDVLQGFPSLTGPYLDAARFAVAGRYLSAAYTAYGQNKFALAGSFSAAGQPIAQDLIDHPGSPFGPVAGAWTKRQLVTEDGWRQHFDRLWGPKAALSVSPSVTCVTDNGDGTYSAEFGFENPNNYDIDVPIGTENRLSPGADSQGQPTEFAPGAKESAFTLKGLTSAIKWTLQGKTVKASLAQSPKCSDVHPPEPQP
ncbi:MAG TPA: hypothetical protein VGQ65_14135 [Thermoanaerobaculia bacterium]|jgi:hypothetical protein|nr:hypothetical protein [Thermoanaerobaculia bacterium]